MTGSGTGWGKTRLQLHSLALLKPDEKKIKNYKTTHEEIAL